MDKSALKLKYNALLLRYKKAEAFMGNDSIPAVDKLKYVDTLNGITHKLGSMLNEIENYSEGEALCGFKSIQEVLITNFDVLVKKYEDKEGA
ncbi:MAG: hypothetical protein ACD_22C00283G0003 [uncultured bacterium]|nr:MAG: hypothetical protein ACD_22C00283G0003 [uncultured bacterium]